MVCSYRCDWSANLGVQRIYNVWVEAGGNPAYGAKMTAVALAESCGDSQANSGPPYCSAGLWQISRTSGTQYTIAQLNDPRINAVEAIRLSNNGDNVAPWDAAYAAGEALTRLSYLHDVQPGSNADAQMRIVESVLGLQPGGGAGGVAGTQPGFPGGIASAGAPPQGAPLGSTEIPFQPVYNPLPYLPQAPQLYQQSDGWDNLNQLVGYDYRTLLAFDNELRRNILFLEAAG